MTIFGVGSEIIKNEEKVENVQLYAELLDRVSLLVIALIN